ncbi:DEAD/DEAH box helicase [Aestuariimicrobium sp. Y1814]|uniref:DEAD/DEAH box helicase n=1 Tax=Aestuariimicrobium sp. Y1814 TaxID=3418742 RepID=UPI003DA742D0
MRLDISALRGATPEGVYEQVVDAAQADGLELYPHQEEAALAILTGANTIVTTPTGSGKSMIAIAAHAAAVAAGGRSWYTAPIKALVSEKFFALCDTFGAANVGMITGDASVNSEAPIICCTAEIVANLALRHGAEAPIDQVVMDEFHFIADPDRGWAWQVGMSELPRAQFVIMSATLGDVTTLADSLHELGGRDSTVISGAQRPVPLAYRWALTPINETVDELVENLQAPVYIVHATQALAFQRAQAMMSTPLVDKDARARIVEALGNFRFGKGFGTTLSQMVRAGIGVHHAGMLPRYRRVVETLAQQGLLRVICGTDTLGVGINVPIRTVLFNALTKFDGQRLRVLRSREFHQIAGRAGRAGFDSIGYVVAQAPEHVIENERALAKIGDDPKKLRKFNRKKPPEGFVNWTEQTFERLQESVPETLHARMRITHAMLLNLLERDQDTVEAVVGLVERATSDPKVRRGLYRRALALGRSLLASGTVVRLDEPTPGGRRFTLSPDLQADFALNQPLSAFATEVLEVLDPDSPDYVLDVVSVIEATLEDPRQVLMAQQFRERGEAVAEMKADGMDYEDRMNALDEVSWPRPLEDLLNHTFGIFQPRHPWIAEAALSPKSIVREMYERAMTFGEYVAWLKLERVEGLLLRYLTDAFRALRQTVPESARTPEFETLLDWLGDTVRMTDSSLLDEWEALTQWDGTSARPQAVPVVVRLTSNERTFQVLVRNALWQRVMLAAADNVDALEALEPNNKDFTGDDWDEALGEYWDEHDDMVLDADARSAARILVDRTDPRRWVVRQIISDPEGNHDWQIHAVVDLDASDEAEALVLHTKAFGRLD